MARKMSDEERRAFLLEGTRTGKVAWVSPKGNVHVAPVWFVLDGDDILFTTHEDSAKGKAFTERTRLSMVVDDQAPPYSYVKVDGTVSLSTDLDELSRRGDPHRRPLHGGGPGRGVRSPQRCPGRARRPDPADQADRPGRCQRLARLTISWRRPGKVSSR